MPMMLIVKDASGMPRTHDVLGRSTGRAAGHRLPPGRASNLLLQLVAAAAVGAKFEIVHVRAGGDVGLMVHVGAVRLARVRVCRQLARRVPVADPGAGAAAVRALR